MEFRQAKAKPSRDQQRQTRGRVSDDDRSPTVSEAERLVLAELQEDLLSTLR